MVGEKWPQDHVDGRPECKEVPEVSAQMGDGPVLTSNKLTSIAIKPKGEIGETAYVNCYVVSTNFPLVLSLPFLSSGGYQLGLPTGSLCSKRPRFVAEKGSHGLMELRDCYLSTTKYASHL